MSDSNYQELIRSRLLNPEGFISATFSGKRRNSELAWQRITIRPVLLKQVWHLQITYFDGRHDIRKNVDQEMAATTIDDLLVLSFSNYFVRTTDEELQIRISKKGKALVNQRAIEASLPDLNHDRRKHLPLPDNQPDPYLQASGIMNAEGKVLASKRSKFVQINKFLQLVEDTGELAEISHRPLRILDCGCGNAYLTFAIHHYLNHVLGIAAETVGVDISENLLQRHQATANEMGWDNIRFEVSSIIDYQPAFQPDMVLALHACDTATDEALAQAIRSNSHLIFSVPCCHHHLQAQLENQSVDSFEPILRHNILRERMGDILTDSFRALILQIMGYKTQVIEFISPEHTARNLMIRAVRRGDMPVQQYVDEYLAMKQQWNVTPYLETLLGERLLGIIDLPLSTRSQME